MGTVHQLIPKRDPERVRQLFAEWEKELARLALIKRLERETGLYAGRTAYRH